MSGTDKMLVVIAGPTAVGKTAFAVSLAKHFKTDILSADSRQFYRDMRIGTAYPKPEELAAAKHHFVGNLALGEEYNVSLFEHEVMLFLEKLFKERNIAILCGGSGLYIDAVCSGIDDLPSHDPSLRKKLKDELSRNGLEKMADRLKSLDPDYHAVVDLKNPNRVLRALEVCIQTGTTYTSLRKNSKKKRSFGILKIGLNIEREELFRRIEERVDSMMEDGLLEEVRKLREFRGANALNTVGYKELFAYLDGEVSLGQAVENIKTNTRRYARRQLTWFRRDDGFRWFSPEQFDEVVKYIDSRRKMP